MIISGVTASGQSVFERPLEHGEDPQRAALRHGYLVVRPLTASRAASGLLLRLLVEPTDSVVTDSPALNPLRDKDLQLAPGEIPVVRQRIAAYAIVSSELGLLATEYSDRTSSPGLWGLPGGGIDEHESPTDALIREIAEETNQDAELGDLVDLQSGHWIGRSPSGQAEDFHTVRLIYRARCLAPTEPKVLDIGGTTESARWIAESSWAELAWTRGWQAILSQHLGLNPR